MQQYVTVYARTLIRYVLLGQCLITEAKEIEGQQLPPFEITLREQMSRPYAVPKRHQSIAVENQIATQLGDLESRRYY